MYRVLQVIGGMNRRGAETFIMNVYRKIDKTKVQFDFLVYSNEKQDFEDEIFSLGGRVIHMPCNVGFKSFLSVPKIKKVIRQYGPYKAIHVQTLLNSAWALLAAKNFPNMLRVTHSHCTHNAVNPNNIQRLYEKLALRIIRKYTQVMLACGEEAGAYLFGKKIKKSGIVMNNGIDLDIHTVKDMNAVVAIRKQYALDGKLVIGNVARFNEVKNHTFMIQIAIALKQKNVPFKMLLVGNGNLQYTIEKQIQDLNLSNEVVCTGLRSDIKDIMFAFDIFLMPSFFEGNPVTLVEAQAAGLPCVITDVITDKMDMGLGLIHRCSLKDTPSVWADAIIEASEHRVYVEQVIRQQLNQHGYDSQATADKLLMIFER